MNNKLVDLNNHLFAQMERLSDENISGDELEQEINRSRAITSVATQIISNGVLALKAEEFKSEVISSREAQVPKFLEG